MSIGNKTHISELICLQVNSLKLSEVKLVQIYDRLVRKGKIRSGFANLQNPSEKVWYVQKYHPFAEVIIARGALGAFIEKFKLDLNDFKKVRGGNTADIRAFEQLKSENNLPAATIKEELNQSLETSILDTVDELTELENSKANMDDLLNQGTFDTTSAVNFDESMDEPPTSASILKPPAFNLSSSMLSRGVDDSIVYSKSLKNNEPKNIPVFTGSANKPDIKLDATASIPVWKKGNSPEENARNVDNYIRDLKRIKTLDVGKNDAWIINSSLVKSQRTEIYVELPSGAESDIAKFTEYIQQAYGLSKVAKRRALNNIKQQDQESPHAFLSRVCNTYFETRNEARKSITECEADSNLKFDIISLYLKGLSNPKVRLALKQKLGELSLATIAEQTRNIVDALSDESVHNTAVNLVVSGNNQINEKVDMLADKLNTLAVNMTKYKDEARNRNKNSENQNNRQRFNNRHHNRNAFSPYHHRPKKWNDRSQFNRNGKDRSFGPRQFGNNSHRGQRQTRFNQNRSNQNPVPPAGVRFYGQCFYCGLSGHSKKFCRKRMFDQERN